MMNFNRTHSRWNFPSSSSHQSNSGSTSEFQFPIRQGHYQDPELLQCSASLSQGEIDGPFDLDTSTGMVYQDPTLDDYDRALLAEPYRDRQWEASHGLARLSLPSQRPNRVFQDRPMRPEPFHPQQSPYRVLVATPENEPVSADVFVSSRTMQSSPNLQTSSSPSYQVAQRRAIQNQRRHNASDLESTSRPVVGTSRSTHEKSRSSRVPAAGPPIVRGISLVSSHELPDRFRGIFPFKLFNAIQSRCFDKVYRSNANIVLSAPTGSGKTVILELAICRSIANHEADQYKIVYMAPTKSLCSERYRDWGSKFFSLGLSCAELTGDTEQNPLHLVQNAHIIITTPEKWDSTTRKWKDQARLMQLVKLFLIDEVHILKESRGAALEAVVSRMKSIDSGVRFVALSATVPNSEDIATWLGLDSTRPHSPAHREVFGEEFRPVRLQKHVYGITNRGNDFSFDTVCDKKLPEIVSNHTARKPIMVFCSTRKSTQNAAKVLVAMCSGTDDRQWPWQRPIKLPRVVDMELKNTLISGVAFHHAGLQTSDRLAVEEAYLKGDISVICCTSTLAVGVNLPCHLVIIKNTTAYQGTGLREYSDLEMMQMLGRAGRPQFDTSAVAIIITKQEKVKKYEALVSGEEILESCLHLNLIDHLNAEIALGTIYNLDTAKRWLSGTFLYVRLTRNPAHYNLDDDQKERSLDERIEQICQRDIQLLQESSLATSNHALKCTEFGDAMARYYVKFKTMKLILSLPKGAKMSEMLSVLAQAEELHEARFRSGEKPLFKLLNSSNGIKFPINVDIALAAHKRSIIIQAELGGVEYPLEEPYAKHRTQFLQDRALVFLNINRLIRCIADCQLHLQDAAAMRNALELSRSLSAKVWDNSPWQLRQIPSIGHVATRKLVAAGVNSLEVLGDTEPARINQILSRNPPFGENVHNMLAKFPKLRVCVKSMGYESNCGHGPKLRFKVDLGFLNDTVPAWFNKKPVYVCFLVERSDGLLVDFKRMSASTVGKEEICLSSELVDEAQFITCHVSCDEIAGSARSAELKHKIPGSEFPRKPLPITSRVLKTDETASKGRPSPFKGDFRTASQVHTESDEFFDADIDDGALLAAAEEIEFIPLEAIEAKARLQSKLGTDAKSSIPQGKESRRLENGKWSCAHKCKDKTLCKHLCCREGLDKKPRQHKTTNRVAPAEGNGPHLKQSRLKASNLPTVSHNSRTVSKTRPVANKEDEIETVDLTQEPRVSGLMQRSRPNRPHSLDRSPVSRFCVPSGGKESRRHQEDEPCPSIQWSSSDYDDSWMEDLPSPSVLMNASKNDASQREDFRQQETLPHVDNILSLNHNLTSSKSNAQNDRYLPSPSYEADVPDEEVDYFSGLAEKGPFHTPTDIEQNDKENSGSQADNRAAEKTKDLVSKQSLESSLKRQISFDALSPDAKRLHHEPGPTGLSTRNEATPVLAGTKCRKPFPFKDMTGIDLDLLAQFEDIVDFQDTD